MSAGPWTQKILDKNGKFSVLFHPNIENLNATVIAPGYENSGVTRNVKIDKNTATMGDIQIGRRIIKDIVPENEIPPRQAGGDLSSQGEF